MSKRYQRGAVPLLFILMMFFASIGGLGYALTQLASPDCKNVSAVSCILDPILKLGRKQDRQQEKEDEIQVQQLLREGKPEPTKAQSALPASSAPRKGSRQLTFAFARFFMGEQTLTVSYDAKTISGTIILTRQGIATNLTVNGTVDPETGDITAGISGISTAKVSYKSSQGSATTQYSGRFVGRIENDGEVSGDMQLTQTITAVTGTIPGYAPGKTDSETIPWQGVAH